MGSEDFQRLNMNRGDKPILGRAVLPHSLNTKAAQQRRPTNGASSILFSSAIAMLVFLNLLYCSQAVSGATFAFPTKNISLLEDGGEERFFTPTPGQTWTTGSFGCVRTEGWQLHEGIDIRALERNARGESIDQVFATADGTVEYVNRKAGLSNYGKYIILRHLIEGIEIFSLYAHLSEVENEVSVGREVLQGEAIAVMGRTTNTRTRISKERAHLHFEVALLASDRFSSWYKETFPGQRNDHKDWNGQNLIGIDPSVLLRGEDQDGEQFSLLGFLRNQTELCRVLVLETDFPWLHRYTRLIRRNPVADIEGVVGYEIALNFSGLPFELIPRAPSEIHSRARIQLLSVNDSEKASHRCGKIVDQPDGEWRFRTKGKRLIDLLIF